MVKIFHFFFLTWMRINLIIMIGIGVTCPIAFPMLYQWNEYISMYFAPNKLLWMVISVLWCLWKTRSLTRLDLLWLQIEEDICVRNKKTELMFYVSLYYYYYYYYYYFMMIIISMKFLLVEGWSMHYLVDLVMLDRWLTSLDRSCMRLRKL